MTREEHLEFCKRCLNRKFDPAKGIICSLTGQIASFEGECEHFKLDSSVVITVDDQVALDTAEIKNKLSPEVYEALRKEQNLFGAIGIGFFTAILSAVLWAAITVTTEYQFSAMALFLGAAVGYAMRMIGKGVDVTFGIWSAGISLFGCILGNFLSVIGFIAHANHLGYFETLLRFDYAYLPDVMMQTFTIRHLIFYMFAIATGFALGKKAITSKDIQVMKGQQAARE